MGLNLPSPSEGEVGAVADLLGVSSNTLSSLKLPGPLPVAGSILTELSGMLPALEGFDPPQQLTLEWDGPRGPEQRYAARYDSPTGSIVVVSHESGPELFLFALEAAAAAATVLASGYAFVRFVGTRGWSDDHEPARLTITRRWYDENGRLRHEEITELDERGE